MGKPLSKKEQERRVAIIERWLKRYPPPHLWRESAARNTRTATAAAAEEIGILPELLKRQIKAGSIPTPDWSIWQGWPEEEVEPDVPVSEYRKLELKCRRMEQEAKVWNSSKKAYQDQIIELEDYNSIIEGVASMFTVPKLKKIDLKHAGGSGHTALVDVSDIHYGATIHAAEINGLNSYNCEIAEARLWQLAKKVVYLLKSHTNVELDEMVVLLKGDLISGGFFLHEEVARTDECQPIEQVQGVSQILSEIILYWAHELGVPIRIYCVPGNHGRITKKNEPSQMVANSLDIAACRFIEAAFKNEPSVTFHIPESGEALFNIYSYPCLAIHGHMMGTGGGSGFYGPVYSMIRGGFKTKLNYQYRGTNLSYCFIGHYHTSAKPLNFLYANGSVCGPDTYAMNQLKAVPEAATQSLFLFNEDKGLIDWREIRLGKPSEGTIYQPNPPQFTLTDEGEVVSI